MQFLKSISFILALVISVPCFCQDFPTGGDAAFPQTIQPAQEPAATQTDGSIWSQEPNQLSADLGTSSFENLSLYGNNNNNGYTTFDEPPGEPGDPGDPVDNAPIDNGLAILLAAGIGIGIKNFMKKKSKKSDIAEAAVAIEKIDVPTVYRTILKHLQPVRLSIASTIKAITKGGMFLCSMQSRIRFSLLITYKNPSHKS